jgi:hypothetical protein
MEGETINFVTRQPQNQIDNAREPLPWNVVELICEFCAPLEYHNVAQVSTVWRKAATDVGNGTAIMQDLHGGLGEKNDEYVVHTSKLEEAAFHNAFVGRKYHVQKNMITCRGKEISYVPPAVFNCEAWWQAFDFAVDRVENIAGRRFLLCALPEKLTFFDDRNGTEKPDNYVVISELMYLFVRGENESGGKRLKLNRWFKHRTTRQREAWKLLEDQKKSIQDNEKEEKN